MAPERILTGPHPGSTVEARYGITPDGRTGIVELAQTCGLARVPGSVPT